MLWVGPDHHLAFYLRLSGGGKLCVDSGWWLVEAQKVFTSRYNDVIMNTMASQVTSLTIDCSTLYLGADLRKHQSSAASLAFVRGIHRWPVNSPHKGPVKRKMFPFHDVIMGVESWRSDKPQSLQWRDNLSSGLTFLLQYTNCTAMVQSFMSSHRW